MQCQTCKTNNDPDAVFCTECGKTLAGQPQKQRRPYLIALFFVPVLVLAAAVGYYKFFLPDGVAAVVNGEEIRLSELNAAVSRMQGEQGTPPAGLRSQALNELVMERLVLQEAAKAGITASKEEVAAAVAQARAASGPDEKAFRKEVESLYGSMRGFEKFLERRIAINRLIAEKIAPRGADREAAARAVDQWLRDLSGKAAVRIALAEQWSGGGCGCCSKGGDQAGQRGPGCATAKRPLAADSTRTASEAGLRYWHAKHGPDAVETRLRDFGCHVQIDIVKNEKIIGSLRYQDGNITEI
jgi:SurA-like protein